MMKHKKISKNYKFEINIKKSSLYIKELIKLKETRQIYEQSLI